MKTISEKNEQIARMMGLKRIKIPKGMLEDLYEKPIWVGKDFPEIYPEDGHIPYEDNDEDGFWKHFSPQMEELHYDHNWSMLMRAVDFIEKHGAWVTIKGCEVIIGKKIEVVRENKILATFEAVYLFAEKYNEQNNL